MVAMAYVLLHLQNVYFCHTTSKLEITYNFQNMSRLPTSLPTTTRSLSNNSLKFGCCSSYSFAETVRAKDRKATRESQAGLGVHTGRVSPPEGFEPTDPTQF